MNFGGLAAKALDEGERRAKKEAKKEAKQAKKEAKKIKKELSPELKEDLHDIKEEVKYLKKDVKHLEKDLTHLSEEVDHVQHIAHEIDEVDIKDLTRAGKEAKAAKKEIKKDAKHLEKDAHKAGSSPSGILGRFKKGSGGASSTASLSSSTTSSSSVSADLSGSGHATTTTTTASAVGDGERKREKVLHQGQDFPPLPDLSRPEKEGWLTKQGQKFKSWRERWFTLAGLGYLHYRKTPNDVTPIGSLWLAGAEVKFEDGLKRAGFNFSVVLVHPKSRILYLSAKTADERREWMEAILNGSYSADSVLSSSPVTSPRGLMCQNVDSFSGREFTVDLPDMKDEGSDEEDIKEIPGEEEKALLAKTLLNKSMWGPADIEALDNAGFLPQPETHHAFSTWYGIVGMTIGGVGYSAVTRNVVVADASDNTFAWCSLRLRGRISVIGKEEVLKNGTKEELEGIQQSLMSPVKQYLCEAKEGWMFYVYVSPHEKQAGNLGNRDPTSSTPRIKMAADSKREMEDWAQFLWNRGLEGRKKQLVNGFLWIKKEKVWQRYYCIADANYFEWFEPEKFRAVPLAELSLGGAESLKINRPKQKSSSFHIRNVLDNYERALVMTDGKKTMCLYTADDDHFNYWKRAISSKEVLKLSCAADFATAAINGTTPEQESKKGLLSEQGNAKIMKTQTATVLPDLINGARLLCERANQATGKSSLGNYPLTDIGSKDGQYRILSLDGGGLRAVMEAVILTRLTEVFPDLLSKFDLIVGVSGGSMVAAGLATGRSPQFLTEMFQVIGPYCFKQKAASVQWFSLNQAKFPRDPLEAFGAEVFQHMKLRDLPRRVAMTSFLLDNEAEGTNRSWEPRIYHNLPLQQEYEEKEGAWKDQELWKCVLSSSAAPIYFPTHGKHMDGAVMVNNPAMTALALVMSEKVVERQDPQRVHLLSLGTGRMVQFIDGENLDWGMIQWAPKLPELIVKAGLLHQEEMVRLILGERFHQCNPLMEKFLDMDNPAILSELIDLAQKIDLAPTIAWVNKHLYNGERAVPTETTTQASPEVIPVESSNAASQEPKKDLSCDLSAFYSAPLVIPEVTAQEE